MITPAVAKESKTLSDEGQPVIHSSCMFKKAGMKNV